MRKVVLVSFFVFTLILKSQTILWERIIPFESDDEGPVGINVADNGDILIACYTNGPNYAVYGDSTVHFPSTKIISLKQDGNFVSSEEFGTVFSDGIKGMGSTDQGYTMIGNHSNGDPNFVCGSGWQIYYENEICDTVEYKSGYINAGYSFREMKSSHLHQTISRLSYFDRFFKSSNGHEMIMDLNGDIIAGKYMIDFPDSLFIGGYEDEFIYWFEITDYDMSSDGSIFLTGTISGMYLNNTYSFLIKIDGNGDVVWQKYFLGYASLNDHLSYFEKTVSATEDGGCLWGVWKDLDDDFDHDENENFIDYIDATGNVQSTLGPYNELVEFTHRIGIDEYILRITGSDNIIKFTLSDNDFFTDWTYNVSNADLIRPVEEGFISAGTDGQNIVIKKINTATSIEDSSPLPDSAALYQNYPNPFNPVTEIKFSLTTKSEIGLSVYNIAGELVADLAKGKFESGHHTLSFDASDLNSGIYFYRLQTDGRTIAAKRMLLIK